MRRTVRDPLPRLVRFAVFLIWPHFGAGCHSVDARLLGARVGVAPSVWAVVGPRTSDAWRPNSKAVSFRLLVSLAGRHNDRDAVREAYPAAGASQCAQSTA